MFLKNPKILLQSILNRLFLLTLYSAGLLAGPIKFASNNSAITVASGSTLKVFNQLTDNGGMLVKKSGSVITGNASGVNLIFNDGYFDNGNLARLSANYNVFGTANMLLAGSQVINASPLAKIEGLTVSGTGNKILGMPTFTGTPTLASGAELQLGIENDMTVNLALASGTLTLLNDLSWADTFKPTGTGNINLNSGYKFILGSQPLTFSSAITWQNTGELVLHSKTTLTATWSVSNNMTINGSGNVLDITGGVLAIASGATLNLTNVYLKGWGASNLTFVDTSSNLRLSNVVIDLTASVTLTTGNVYVDGPATIITQNNVLTFSSNAVLTVDGNTLWYDPQSYAPNNNILPTTAGANLVLSNGGVVTSVGSGSLVVSSLASINSALATIDHGPSNVTLSGSTTLSYDYNLSDDHTMTISATGTINGNGHRIRFSNNKTAQLIINTGVTATFTNCIFENFADEHLSLVGTGSMVFGSGCVVNVMSNDTWTKAYTFGANTVLNGNNGVINLSTGSISTTTAGGLRLLDITINGVAGTNLTASSGTAKLFLNNATFVMTTGNWTWTTGFWEVERDSLVQGPFIFSYQSTATSIIGSNASLRIASGTTFQYSPSSGNTQISLVDVTSVLQFENNSTLNVGTTGLILINGTLRVNGLLTVVSAAGSDAQAIKFGNNIYANDLTIEINQAGRLLVTSGIVIYQNKELAPAILWSSKIALKNKTFGYFLGFALNGVLYSHVGGPTVYDTATPARAAGGVAVLDDYARFIPYPPFYTGQVGTQYTAGSTVDFVNVAAYNASELLKGLAIVNHTKPNQSFSSPVSSPLPPYGAIWGDNIQNGPGIHWQIYKKLSSYATSFAYTGVIRQGDVVYMRGQFGVQPMLYGTNNTFTVSGYTFNEVVGYQGQAGDGKDEWIVYEVS